MSSEREVVMEDSVNFTPNEESQSRIANSKNKMTNGNDHVLNKEDAPRTSEMSQTSGKHNGDVIVGARISNSSSSEEELNQLVSDRGDHAKESSAAEFVEPDEELRLKIVKQVEFYFSDANIVKDHFLLKFVRRHKQGYVPMKVILSFKKMKSLTKDPRVVAFSLRDSQVVEVNENGNKIRRQNPVPEYDENMPLRTVVAVNLEKYPTVESVAREFSGCSGVTLIRILRPEQTVPPDVSKFASQHREIGNAVCAVIEFENEGQAKKACKLMTNTADWRNGRRVVLLSNKKVKKDKANTSGKETNSKVLDNGQESGDKRGQKKNGRNKKHKALEKSSSSASSDDEAPQTSTSNPVNGSDHVSSRSSSGSSPESQRHPNRGRRGARPDAGPHNGRHVSHLQQKAGTAESAPWVQRRLRAAQQALGGGDGPAASVVMRGAVQGVVKLRDPRKPDGTRGFSGLGRGNPRCNTIA